MQLDDFLVNLTRVGKTTASRLKKLELFTVEDLLFYYPFRYEDFSKIRKISDLKPEEPVTIKGKIQLIANRRTFRKRKILTEALVSDESGSIKVIWFNQPFLTKNLKVGDSVFLSGRLNQDKMQMISPDYEKVKPDVPAVHTARIIPIYHLVQGLTQKQLRFLLSQAIKAVDQIQEYLPRDIIEKYRFPDIKKALNDIHFPPNGGAVAKARARLKFDELFLLQCKIQQIKKQIQKHKALPVKFLQKPTKDFVAKLPFKLTGAQKRCSWEILQDLEKEKPMNRLLQGDVGSGKTIVAALAILNTVKNGCKVILMAPTEILAEQHYQTFKKLFISHKFDIGLFTGSRKFINDQKLTKPNFLEYLANAEFDIIVGTQALIQEKVKIKDLGLVIVDEQHRFGVDQRKKLLSRDQQAEFLPHFLSMTATPIPRTLVLTLYGDLDLSVIDKMPTGRKPIKTKLVFEQDRWQTYEFIKKQIKQGRQVFVICPLIDPSDRTGARSVKQEFEKMDKDIFPDLKIGLMHGRLKPKEKKQVMKEFSQHKLDILVSTSVIEVGIDVPNAGIMMIEGAENFGLAQLHQFRGRVGRSGNQSYCFLFTESSSPETKKRLGYLEDCTDGFELAEKDLQSRGPGEVYGIRQSGLPDLKIASLTDRKLIALAAEEAKNTLSTGISPVLKQKLAEIKFNYHQE